MSVSGTMTLTRGSYHVHIPPPEPGYTCQVNRRQVVGETAAGDQYVYDKAVTTYNVRLTVTMTAAEWAAFEAFVNTYLVGCMHTFTWLDHTGVSHTDCRLLEPARQVPKTPGARHRVDLAIRTKEVVA